MVTLVITIPRVWLMSSRVGVDLSVEIANRVDNLGRKTSGNNSNEVRISYLLHRTSLSAYVRLRR